jgi:hypothetical protein
VEEDEVGDGLGGVGYDAGVGVRGQHDAGVTEQSLDGLEVGADGQGEAGGATSCACAQAQRELRRRRRTQSRLAPTRVE